jgi:hypothetical protein
MWNEVGAPPATPRAGQDDVRWLEAFLGSTRVFFLYLERDDAEKPRSEASASGRHSRPTTAAFRGWREQLQT